MANLRFNYNSYELESQFLYTDNIQNIPFISNNISSPLAIVMLVKQNISALGDIFCSMEYCMFWELYRQNYYYSVWYGS